MPILSNSDYKPAFWWRQTDFNTIYAASARRVPALPTHRVAMPTDDGDVVYLDWAQQPSARHLVVCLHGLEGHAQRPYMQGMMRRFYQEGWDAVGLNYRGCTGEDNRHLYSYHSGWTTDLETLMRRLIAADAVIFPEKKIKNYQNIVVLGVKWLV